MKLNKATMIAMIDKIEADVIVKQDEHAEALAKHNDKMLREWKATELPKLKNLRDLLTKKLKTSSAISVSEIRDLGFRDNWSGATFHWYSPALRSSSFEIDGQKYYKGHPVVDPRLKALRSALEVINEDEVSTSALTNFGFRNLEWFFTRAAQVAQAA